MSDWHLESSWSVRKWVHWNGKPHLVSDEYFWRRFCSAHVQFLQHLLSFRETGSIRNVVDNQKSIGTLRQNVCLNSQRYWKWLSLAHVGCGKVMCSVVSVCQSVQEERGEGSYVVRYAWCHWSPPPHGPAQTYSPGPPQLLTSNWKAFFLISYRWYASHNQRSSENRHVHKKKLSWITGDH